MIGVALIIVGVVLPIGILYVSNFSNYQMLINGSLVKMSDVLDSGVSTMITVLLPLLAIIGIALTFFYTSKKKG